MQQRAQFYADSADTPNRSCLTLYDVIHYSDVISALDSYMFRRNMHAFYWCINFENLFSLAYQLAKLFECPS